MRDWPEGIRHRRDGFTRDYGRKSPDPGNESLLGPLSCDLLGSRDGGGLDDGRKGNRRSDSCGTGSLGHGIENRSHAEIAERDVRHVSLPPKYFRQDEHGGQDSASDKRDGAYAHAAGQ